MSRKKVKPIKTLVAIPCMNTVPTDFMLSMLRLNRVPETHYSTTVATLIYDSRNTFAVKAITEGYDRIMFIDSDMVFEPDMLERLSADMDTGLDYVSGLFFCRRFPIKPMIYRKAEVTKADDGNPKAETESYMDYPRDAVFEIQGSGFGAVLIKTELIRKVWDKFGPPFMPTPIMGEDLAFCLRARQLGAKLYCDSRVKVGHIGQHIFDESVYLDRWKAEPAAPRTDMYQPETSIGKAEHALPDMRKQNNRRR